MTGMLTEGELPSLEQTAQIPPIENIPRRGFLSKFINSARQNAIGPETTGIKALFPRNGLIFSSLNRFIPPENKTQLKSFLEKHVTSWNAKISRRKFLVAASAYGALFDEQAMKPLTDVLFPRNIEDDDSVKELIALDPSENIRTKRLTSFGDSIGAGYVETEKTFFPMTNELIKDMEARECHWTVDERASKGQTLKETKEQIIKWKSSLKGKGEETDVVISAISNDVINKLLGTPEMEKIMESAAKNPFDIPVLIQFSKVFKSILAEANSELQDIMYELSTVDETKMKINRVIFLGVPDMQNMIPTKEGMAILNDEKRAKFAQLLDSNPIVRWFIGRLSYNLDVTVADSIKEFTEKKSDKKFDVYMINYFKKLGKEGLRGIHPTRKGYETIGKICSSRINMDAALADAGSIH